MGHQDLLYAVVWLLLLIFIAWPLASFLAFFWIVIQVLSL